jgi:hypothetical protein
MMVHVMVLSEQRGSHLALSVGKVVMKPQRSDVDKENEVLLAGYSVVVYNINFKLVRKD